MPPTLEQLLQLAMELPYEDRQKLSEELWWSLHPPAEDLPQAEINAAWDAEIKRRIEEADSGAVKLISGKQFFAEMRRWCRTLVRAKSSK